MVKKKTFFPAKNTLEFRKVPNFENFNLKIEKVRFSSISDMTVRNLSLKRLVLKTGKFYDCFNSLNIQGGNKLLLL